MPVLLSLLTPGCQTQWLKSPGSSHSSPYPGDGPAHLCLHRRLPSEGSWESTLTEQAAWKWAPGHSEQVSPDSHVLTVTSAVTASRYGMTVTRRVRPLMKRQDIWLVACMSLGRMLTPVCHPSLTVLTKHPYACAQLCMGVNLLRPSALSHTQISIWVKVASLPDFFVLSGVFIGSLKCNSSRLYCYLHIWYHLKKLAIN